MLNAPFILLEVLYLRTTECGLMSDNKIIYLSLALNASFLVLNFVLRLIPCTYFCKRLRSYGRKLDIIINNESLSRFGFKNIRSLVKNN